jgi:hypothetical protein
MFRILSLTSPGNFEVSRPRYRIQASSEICVRCRTYRRRCHGRGGRTDPEAVFRRVRKIAEVTISFVRPSISVSSCPHRTTRLPLNGFS